MDTLKHLSDELTYEYNVTKTFFQKFPHDKNEYAPHAKSMKMIDLVTHIAAIFGWPAVMLKTSELDIAEADESEKVINRTQLLEVLDKEFNASLAGLKKASEKDLEPNWRLTMEGKTLMEWTKYGAIRHSLDQITHHRAQLGLYYRLIDIAVPASYGPSADDQSF